LFSPMVVLIFLHHGHIHLLTAAADFGKHLIVGLNSDASIRRIKKPGRPLQDENSRALVMAALDFVETVILFDEDPPNGTYRQLRPDIIVKGGAITLKPLWEAIFVMGYGWES